MLRLLRPRLGAARLLLDQCNSDGEWEAASHEHSNAIQSLISRQPGLPEVQDADRAGLMDLMMTADWHPDDIAKLTAAMEKPIATKRADRRPLQHFAPAMFAYFTDDEWAAMMSPSRHFITVVNIVVGRTIALGGRNLSEPSSKMITSFILYLVNTSARTLAPAVKFTYFQQIKRELKRLARRGRTDDVPHLGFLPTEPSHLLHDEPALYKSIFGADHPVCCKADLNVVLDIDRSYRCRMIASAAEPSPPTDGTDKGMFALMQQMLAMQQQSLSLVAVSNRQPPLACLQQLARGPSALPAVSSLTDAVRIPVDDVRGACVTLATGGSATPGSSAQSDSPMELALVSAPDALASASDALISAPDAQRSGAGYQLVEFETTPRPMTRAMRCASSVATSTQSIGRPAPSTPPPIMTLALCPHPAIQSVQALDKHHDIDDSQSKCAPWTPVIATALSCAPASPIPRYVAAPATPRSAAAPAAPSAGGSSQASLLLEGFLASKRQQTSKGGRTAAAGAKASEDCHDVAGEDGSASASGHTAEVSTGALAPRSSLPAANKASTPAPGKTTKPATTKGKSAGVRAAKTESRSSHASLPAAKKKAAKQAAVQKASTAQRSDRGRKWTIEHETNRMCWRVRSPLAGSKGFYYGAADREGKSKEAVHAIVVAYVAEQQAHASTAS